MKKITRMFQSQKLKPAKRKVSTAILSEPTKSDHKFNDNFFLEKISNFIYDSIFQEIKLTSVVRQTVNEYLFDHCPTFYLNSKIVAKYFDVYKQGNQDMVFYKIPYGRVAHFYRGAIIINSGQRDHYDSSTLYFIRGTLNIKKLIIDSRAYTKPKNTSKDSEWAYYNNFYISEYAGENRKLNAPRDLDSDKADAIEPNGSGDSDLVLYKCDKPINYKPEDIIKTTYKRTDPFDKLYYSKEIMNVVSDLNQWLKRKDWFLDRNLPYKRGYLIHGPGGTGKSSLARSVGEKFGIPVHHMYLSNMSDYEFKKAWDKAVSTSPSIVLLEDFDAVFNKRVAVNPESTLNFDTVLNTINGIKESNGIILIITTNHIDKIDEAIGVEVSDKNGISSRPGRIDKIIYLGAMEEEMRTKLITKILRDWPEMIDDAVKNTDGYTAAQVQEYCIQRALEKLHG